MNMVNETTILVLCFILTFGFIGYKIADFIKKNLDKYSSDIADKINYSEKLKFEAVRTLDDAKKQENFLNDKLIKMQDDAEKKMQEIKENFKVKLQEIIEKYTSENAKKIELEKSNMLADFEVQTKSIIEEIVRQYVSNMNEDDMQNAVTTAISNIDFKILSSKKTKL